MKRAIVSLMFGLGVLANANAAGDVEAGKTKAATCAACHGPTGVSAIDMYPNLAGQHADYIVKQLKAFKDGSRQDPVMAPMAMPLSDQDMADLGAFFAAQSLSGDSQAADSAEAPAAEVAVATEAPVATAAVVDAAAGKALYMNGDEARSIGACVGCHGDKGDSKVLIYPNLSKQHPEYVAKQLKAFKDGSRANNYAMEQFAAGLTEQEIANIAAYLKSPDVAAKKSSSSAAINVVAKAVGPAKVDGDVAKGKALAGTCVACHGADGNAMVPMYPNIAGQHEGYIAKQLAEFKAGTRKDPVMAGMVAALSADDMKNLAAYFATQKVKEGKKPAQVNEAGKKLYFGGDAARGITACAACHSPSGNGMALANFPALANQHADYIKAQLNKFRTGERGNDMNQMMQNVAVKLTDKDIADITEFLSSL